MNIKCLVKDECIYAELFGELDEYSAEYVRIALDNMLDSANGAKKLILNL